MAVMTAMTFIVVRFLGRELQYHGPFESREKAAEYAENHWGDFKSYVVPLTPIGAPSAERKR